MHHAGETAQQQPPLLQPPNLLHGTVASCGPYTQLWVSITAPVPAAQTLPQVSLHTTSVCRPTWTAQLVSFCHLRMPQHTHILCTRTHTHTHSLLCSLWRGHRLFLSAHLPAADWLSEPCLWWLRHVWGSRGLKQQASQYSLNGKYKCFQFITQWTFYESSLTNFDLKWQACANQSWYPKKVLKKTGNRKLDGLRFYN